MKHQPENAKSRKLCSLIVVIACCACLTADAQDKAGLGPPASSGPSEGARIFSAICASCHGLDGHGGERAPDIAGSRDVQKLSDAGLRKIIHEGVPGTGMPSFPSLSANKVQAVLAHLRTLQGRPPTSSLPGSPASGRLLFGKAGCSECHMVNGAGGFIASDLSVYGRTKSPGELRNVIADPNKYLGERGRVVVAIMQDGRILTGIARNEDNFSLQLQTQDGAFHFLEKSSLRDIQRRTQSLMPSDYGSRLSRQEIDDLVSYLMDASRQPVAPQPRKRKPEH